MMQNLLTKEQYEMMRKDWEKHVLHKADEVDPSDEVCWWSMTLGFALGRGYSPEEAREFAFTSYYNK